MTAYERLFQVKTGEGGRSEEEVGKSWMKADRLDLFCGGWGLVGVAGRQAIKLNWLQPSICEWLQLSGSDKGGLFEDVFQT